jgi:hypothetical protein
MMDGGDGQAFIHPRASFNATHIRLSLAGFLPRIARLRFTGHFATGCRLIVRFNFGH